MLHDCTTTMLKSNNMMTTHRGRAQHKKDTITEKITREITRGDE